MCSVLLVTIKNKSDLGNENLIVTERSESVGQILPQTYYVAYMVYAGKKTEKNFIPLRMKSTFALTSQEHP